MRARALGHSQRGVFALTPICFPQLLEQCLSIYYGSVVDPMEGESLCVEGDVRCAKRTEFINYLVLSSHLEVGKEAEGRWRGKGCWNPRTDGGTERDQLV